MDLQQRGIQNALPFVAKAIGRKAGVNVVIGARQASTDLETIYLPDLPFEDPDVETLAYGFLEHEAAHVRYTEEVDDLVESDLHHHLTNIFEDIRIEKKLGEEYPGFKVTLRKLVKKLVSDGHIFQAPTPDRPLAGKLESYLLYRMRSQVLGQHALDQYAEVAENLFREEVSPGLAARIGSTIGRAPAMTSTRDAALLAAEVIQLIKDEKEKPKPPENNQEDQGEGQGSQQQENTPSSGDAGSDPQSGSGDGGNQSEGGTEQGAAGQETMDPAMEKKLTELLEASDQDLGKDMGEQLGELLTEKAQESERESGSMSAGIGQASEPLTGVGDPSKLLSEVRASSSALRTRLRGLLEASRRTNVRPSRHGHRIDANQLVPVMMGDPRLFEKKTRKKDVNTVVHVLLDRSGSMDKMMEIARQSTLSAVSALDAIPRIKVGAAAFPGYQSDVEILTAFHERVITTASRYASIRADGGTPLLPALTWSVDQVLQCREERKIILVITDGIPSQASACEEAIKRCWAGGIEVLGLGIRVPSVSGLFPISACITNVNELAPAVFSMLQQTLTQRRVA